MPGICPGKIDFTASNYDRLSARLGPLRFKVKFYPVFLGDRVERVPVPCVVDCPPLGTVRLHKSVLCCILHLSAALYVDFAPLPTTTGFREMMRP